MVRADAHARGRYCNGSRSARQFMGAALAPWPRAPTFGRLSWTAICRRLRTPQTGRYLGHDGFVDKTHSFCAKKIEAIGRRLPLIKGKRQAGRSVVHGERPTAIAHSLLARHGAWRGSYVAGRRPLAALRQAPRRCGVRGPARRHGPMVLGVCRRVLHNASDAEDAFQAAFIVLACKAHSIARPELLGSWLYRAAFRTALRARAEKARRREQSAPLVDRAAPVSAAAVELDELRRVLDEEIDRLPERYRVPVVLCYLEGRTNDEAARHLGCPVGTIASRLATARARLRPPNSTRSRSSGGCVRIALGRGLAVRGRARRAGRCGARGRSSGNLNICGHPRERSVTGHVTIAHSHGGHRGDPAWAHGRRGRLVRNSARRRRASAGSTAGAGCGRR